MKSVLSVLPMVITLALVINGCSNPQAKLSYSVLPKEGADGTGYPFVIPRTVVKVTPTFDKDNVLTSVAFATVPVVTDSNRMPLPAFLATDSSVSGWALTPTTISSVTYVDDLIISAIGTQVTDNRTAAVGTLITTASMVSAFAGSSCDGNPTFQPFIIDDLSVGAEVPHDKNQPSCFLYTIKQRTLGATAMKAEDVDKLAAYQSAAWFPIPACKTYTISVARCKDSNCTEQTGSAYSSTVSISDGKQFRKVPLPLKGKVALHVDFCGADATNEGAGGSDWSVAKALVEGLKTATSTK